MTELLLQWLADYGIWLIGATTLLSCLAIPVPSSILMLTAGGFVASGDMVGWSVVASAFGGAIVGDQIGYVIGRTGGAAIISRLARNARRAKLVARATEYLRQRGIVAVFLSRWLVSPLGPYVNLASGASQLGWHRFSAASFSGEAVWVAVYVSAGYAFADRLIEVSSLLSNASGMLAAGTVTILLGLWLRHSVKSARIRTNDHRKQNS
jgi:membrane-associated protein